MCVHVCVHVCLHVCVCVHICLCVCVHLCVINTHLFGQSLDAIIQRALKNPHVRPYAKLRNSRLVRCESQDNDIIS